VALVIAGLVAVLATRAPALDKVADSPLIGHIAPDVTGTALDARCLASTRSPPANAR